MSNLAHSHAVLHLQQAGHRWKQGQRWQCCRSVYLAI
jgi:hypothetical protein